MTWPSLTSSGPAGQGTALAMRRRMLLSARDPQGDASTSCLCHTGLVNRVPPPVQVGRSIELTVIPLGDAVLDATPLCQVGDLGPVFIGVGIRTESTARAMAVPRPGVWVAEGTATMHSRVSGSMT